MLLMHRQLQNRTVDESFKSWVAALLGPLRRPEAFPVWQSCYLIRSLLEHLSEFPQRHRTNLVTSSEVVCIISLQSHFLLAAAFDSLLLFPRFSFAWPVSLARIVMETEVVLRGLINLIINSSSSERFLVFSPPFKIQIVNPILPPPHFSQSN